MSSILVIAGPAEGQHFRLPDESIVSVGRDDTCTIQIVDPSVSRKHLQLRRDRITGARIAADYRSSNGVWINGHQLVSDVRLRDGDKIKIGKTTVVYMDGDHPDAESAILEFRSKDEWQQGTLAVDDWSE